jgi:tetratricopeptide (TPR) repeat protein
MYRWVFLFLTFSLNSFSEGNDTLLPRILSLTNDTVKFNRLYETGFALRNKDPFKAYQYASYAEKVAAATGLQKLIAKSYNLLGILFYKKGNFKNALSYHNRALKIRQATKDIAGMAQSFLNAANIYSDLKIFKKAEETYLAALDAYTQVGNLKQQLNCLTNLGTLNHEFKNYEAAFQNYSMAYSLAEENDYETKAMCLTNMSVYYMNHKELEKALAANEDAIQLRVLSENTREIADNILNIGLIHTDLKNYAEAKGYIDSAYHLAAQYAYFSLQHTACRTYSHYYDETKNYELAYFWMKRYHAIKDSLFLQELQSQVYDLEEEQEEVAEDVPSKMKSYWLILLLAGMVVAVPYILIQYKR